MLLFKLLGTKSNLSLRQIQLFRYYHHHTTFPFLCCFFFFVFSLVHSFVFSLRSWWTPWSDEVHPFTMQSSLHCKHWMLTMFVSFPGCLTHALLWYTNIPSVFNVVSFDEVKKIQYFLLSLLMLNGFHERLSLKLLLATHTVLQYQTSRLYSSVVTKVVSLP